MVCPPPKGEGHSKGVQTCIALVKQSADLKLTHGAKAMPKNSESPRQRAPGEGVVGPNSPEDSPQFSWVCDKMYFLRRIVMCLE